MMKPKLPYGLTASDHFLPMRMADLDNIMAIEPVIYPYPWTRGNFSDSMHAGYTARVLWRDKTILGYALMMLVLDEAHLLNLSIAQAYQKQGLGRCLLEHMVDLAKHHGAANMFLEVRTSNTSAIALYENTGFNEMTIRRGYYPAKNGREDAVLMGLAIK